MKRSSTTDKIKSLYLAGKSDYEVAAEVGYPVKTVRNRFNYLVRKGELTAKRGELTALLEQYSPLGIPEAFIKAVAHISESTEQVHQTLETWTAQGGHCALTGRPLAKSDSTEPVLVTAADNTPKIISNAVNRLRGGMPIDAFISMCKLIAGRFPN